MPTDDGPNMMKLLQNGWLFAIQIEKKCVKELIVLGDAKPVHCPSKRVAVLTTFYPVRTIVIT
jgi:hypothetical protein